MVLHLTQKQQLQPRKNEDVQPSSISAGYRRRRVGLPVWRSLRKCSCWAGYVALLHHFWHPAGNTLLLCRKIIHTVPVLKVYSKLWIYHHCAWGKKLQKIQRHLQILKLVSYRHYSVSFTYLTADIWVI